MTNDERSKLFKGYLATHLTDSKSTGKDIRHILKRADDLSSGEIKRYLDIITAKPTADGAKLALYLTAKDFGGPKMVWFNSEGGAYKTKCPECKATVNLDKFGPTISRGICKKCNEEWIVSWFGGMSIIRPNKSFEWD
jgi:hypothetical protein